MGQAKARGSKEQRIKLAIQENEKAMKEYAEKHKNDKDVEFPKFLLPYIGLPIMYYNLAKKIYKE